MRRFSLLIALFASAAVLLPAAGQACSRDDAVFFETFVDLSCLQCPKALREAMEFGIRPDFLRHEFE